MSRVVKEYKVKEFQRLLIDNGYEFKRYTGDHLVYSNGINTISVPRNNKTVNMMLTRRLIKENNLIDTNR